VPDDLEPVAVERELVLHRAAVVDRHLVRAVGPGVHALSGRGEPAEHRGLGRQVAQLTIDRLDVRRLALRRSGANLHRRPSAWLTCVSQSRTQGSILSTTNISPGPPGTTWPRENPCQATTGGGA